MGQFSYAFDDILNISFAAHRINNGYEKISCNYAADAHRYSNRDIVALTAAATLTAATEAYRPAMPNGFVPAVVTEQDRLQTQATHKFFRRFTMLILGDSLTEFQKDMYTAYLQEDVTSQNLGLLAYIPSFIENEAATIAYKQNLKDNYYNSQDIAVGKWINGDVEVLKRIYLKHHDLYLYFVGLGGDLISFVKDEKYNIGEVVRLRAKSKKRETERDSGLTMTAVNYAKIQKLEKNT